MQTDAVQNNKDIIMIYIQVLARLDYSYYDYNCQQNKEFSPF